MSTDPAAPSLTVEPSGPQRPVPAAASSSAMPEQAGTHSSFRRASHIARVLDRRKLWFLLEAFDLERFIPSHLHTSHSASRDERHSQAVRLRLALEELGPTFIKLGQLLSTRPDLLPPEYQAELSRMQDDAPADPFEAIREAIEAELGTPIDQAFASFESTPLAAASIGQAYLATLHDGTEIIVKVRRPGAVEQVDEDLKLLHSLAATATHRSAIAKQYDLLGLTQEFDQTLRAELDYLREGHNAMRFARNFVGHSEVQIPTIYWDSSTSRVLTLERIRGMKVTDLAALEAAGIDRVELSTTAAQVFLKMVFEDGFFHADLHPGNVFIEPSGTIGLIDFGMVGTVDDTTRQGLSTLVVAWMQQDSERMVDGLLSLGMTGPQLDRPAVR